MKKLRGIVESTIAPQDTGILWINGSEAKYFNNGLWIKIGQEATLSRSGEEMGLPIFYLGTTKAELDNNLSVASSMGLTEIKSVIVKGTLNDITYDIIGNYYNGEISYTKGSTVEALDVNFNTGEITLKLT